jgi:hypothetical protein
LSQDIYIVDIGEIKKGYRDVTVEVEFLEYHKDHIDGYSLNKVYFGHIYLRLKKTGAFKWKVDDVLTFDIKDKNTDVD